MADGHLVTRAALALTMEVETAIFSDIKTRECFLKSNCATRDACCITLSFSLVLLLLVNRKAYRHFLSPHHSSLSLFPLIVPVVSVALYDIIIILVAARRTFLLLPLVHVGGHFPFCGMPS